MIPPAPTCYYKLLGILSICSLSTIAFPVLADTATASGLIAEYTDKNTTDWLGLKGSAWSVGGWATGGIGYNTDNPGNHTNGPVNMTDRNSELNLYQLNVYLEKAVTKSTHWDIGGRVDYLFGTDTRYTQAAGDWDTHLMKPDSYYNMAIPQAYAEIYAPIGNGLSAKIGHFYTIIGYESVPSGLNFFSSHTYSFKSSPFTTTGALFNYTINNQWSINLGAVKGMDNFDLNPAAWAQMSSINWANANTGTSLSFSIMQGNGYQNMPNNDLEYYSAIFQQQFGKWLYVLQHDRGTLNHAANNGQSTAAWYSIVNYLTYQLNDNLGLGVRGEWFRDQSGFRYGYGESSLYDVTAGINWKPKSWLLIRPEARYDWAIGSIAPFDSGHQFSQVLLGMDAVVQF